MDKGPSSILQYIAEPFNAIFKLILPNYQNDLDISFTASSFADFQSASLIKIAKQNNLNAVELANKLTNELLKQQHKNNKRALFKKIWVTEPGFINVNIDDQLLVEAVMQLYKQPLNMPKDNHQKIIIDFCGANIAKPLHIGHLRSLVIGDFIQKIYRLYHSQVLSDMHLGDWGTQIGMLLSDIKRRYPKLDYFAPEVITKDRKAIHISMDQLSSIYPEAVERCLTDKNALEEARSLIQQVQKGHPNLTALWQDIYSISVNYLKGLVGKLNITYDLWKGESDVEYLIQDVLKEGFDKQILRYDQGAVVVDTHASGQPLLLIKSDGAALYSMTDLATIKERMMAGTTKIIYVVDKRQSLHFKQVFACAEKFGWPLEFFHVAIGVVNDKYGQPFKTRAGSTLLLEDVLSQARNFVRKNDALTEEDISRISLANIKFAMLSYRYSSNCNFDLEKFSNYDGKTGSYILYAVVRIRALIRKNKQDYNDFYCKLQPAANSFERDLQHVLANYPEALNSAYHYYEPYYLCEHAYKLACAFNKFYDNQTILHEKEEGRKQAKISLCISCLIQFEQLLPLIGIEIPLAM